MVNPDLKTLYFVIYCPEVRSHPMHVITVTRKELRDQIQAYTEAECEFVEEVDEIENELRA